MQGNIKLRIFSAISLMIWMSVIFMMSSQPAEVSSETSGGFVEKIVNVIYSDFDNLPSSQQIKITNDITFLTRKAAHFLEYFILGILSAVLVFTFRTKSIPIKILGVTGFNVFYAISDEIHQYFIPGRACRILDICIDSIGAVCAVVLVALVAIIKNKSGELNA